MQGKIKAAWKSGFGFYHADAQIVAEEILSIGEEATPKQILDKGRDKNTELHKCFEWDDSIAAEKFRLEQAKDIVSKLVFIRSEEQANRNMPEVRVFHKTSNTSDSGYKTLMTIVRDEDEYKKMLQQAYADLHALKVKYSYLQELDYILSLIP